MNAFFISLNNVLIIYLVCLTVVYVIDRPQKQRIHRRQKLGQRIIENLSELDHVKDEMMTRQEKNNEHKKIRLQQKLRPS